MIFDFAIGCNVDLNALSPKHFIICLPGEKLPSGKQGAECSSLAEANFVLRVRFADPCEVVTTLPFLRVVRGRTDNEAMRDEWEQSLIWRISQIVDELGNDPHDAWLGVGNMYGLWKAFPQAGSSDSLYHKHAGEPAVCLGAGPTAEDHMAEIAEKKKHLRVFATDVMVQSCLRHGFMPDYICSIERIPGTSKVYETMPRMETATLICPPVIPPDCAGKVGNVIFWLSGDSYANWLSQRKHRELNPGPSCGTMSISAAMECQCSPIYLVGHDLSYLDGASHASSSHKETQQHASCYKDPGHTWWKQELDSTDCFGKPIKTTGLWQSFRRSIEDEIILRDASKLDIRNVRTRGGQQINGTTVHASIGEHVRILDPVSVLPWSNRRTIKWASQIRDHFQRASESCAAMHDKFISKKASLEEAAKHALISTLFLKEDIPLANYLLQQIYNSAHFHRARGAPSDWNVRRTLKSLAMHTAKHVRLMKEWQDD